MMTTDIRDRAAIATMRHCREIHEMLVTLAEYTDGIIIDAENGNTSWGKAGDMAHVAARLAEMVEFLGLQRN